MDLKLLTYLPLKPQEYLDFATTALGLSVDEASKLCFLTLKIKSSRATPIYEFLGRTLNFLKFDEIGKQEYLLTLSIHTIRRILAENLDLKFSKNLYSFLKEVLPSPFLKGYHPKRDILVSQDLCFEILSPEEKAKLPPYLKVNHQILVYFLGGTCEEIIFLIDLLGLWVIKRKENNFLNLYFPFSLAEFIWFSQKLIERKLIKDLELEGIKNQLKNFFPDCFGEI